MNSWLKLESKDALLVSFYAKQLGLVLFFYRVSLVEYPSTQGFITPVAGEVQEPTCFGPCCVTIVEVDDEEE